MADQYKVNADDLTAVANAIRAKTGSAGALSFPGGFVSAVENISAGGSKPKLIHLTVNHDADDRDNFYVYGTFADENGQIVSCQWTPASGDDIFIPFDGASAFIVVEYYPNDTYSWVSNSAIFSGDMEGYPLVGAYELSVYGMSPSGEEKDVYEVSVDVRCEYGGEW